VWKPNLALLCREKDEKNWLRLDSATRGKTENAKIRKQGRRRGRGADQACRGEGTGGGRVTSFLFLVGGVPKVFRVKTVQGGGVKKTTSLKCDWTLGKRMTREDDWNLAKRIRSSRKGKIRDMEREGAKFQRPSSESRSYRLRGKILEKKKGGDFTPLHVHRKDQREVEENQ